MDKNKIIESLRKKLQKEKEERFILFNRVRKNLPDKEKSFMTEETRIIKTLINEGACG